jgi:hypothetical protein
LRERKIDYFPEALEGGSVERRIRSCHGIHFDVEEEELFRDDTGARVKSGTQCRKARAVRRKTRLFVELAESGSAKPGIAGFPGLDETGGQFPELTPPPSFRRRLGGLPIVDRRPDRASEKHVSSVRRDVVRRDHDRVERLAIHRVV